MSVQMTHVSKDLGAIIHKHYYWFCVLLMRIPDYYYCSVYIQKTVMFLLDMTTTTLSIFYREQLVVFALYV